LGLVFFSALRFLNNAFYALQDTKTPVKVSAFCLIFNVVLGILLMWPLKHAGLALTTSLVAAIDVFLLVFLLERQIGKTFNKNFYISLLKIALASLGMGGCLWTYQHWQRSEVRQLIEGIPLGILTFFCFAFMLKCEEVEVI